MGNPISFKLPTHESRFRSGMLASVTNLHEACRVAACGVDIIDLKNPLEGALGALQVDDVRMIVGKVRGVAPISATLGDLPLLPEVVVPAARLMAKSGVDLIKVGFFQGGDWRGVLSALRPMAEEGQRFIAVLFADHSPDLETLSAFSAAGFSGVMLDTADKRAGPLPSLTSMSFLQEFVRESRRLRMISGLAGSLREQDIPALWDLSPDYLGFRGALCGGVRTAGIDEGLVRRIRMQIHSMADPEGSVQMTPRLIPWKPRHKLYQAH